MNKAEYLKAVEEKLVGVSKADKERFLDYCRELIEDGMEEGMTEDEAIQTLGSPEQMAGQLLLDTKLPEQEKTKRKYKAWEIVLLILGSPIWVSLLLSLLSVLLSFYIVLWTAVLVLYVCVLSFAVCLPAGVLSGIFLLCVGEAAQGSLTIGAGLICGALGMALFPGCNALAAGCLRFTKRLILWMVKPFRKEKSE